MAGKSMRQFGRRWARWLVLALLALVVPASSAAAPTWLAPRDLSGPEQTLTGTSPAPRVAVDAAGNAVAVWEQVASNDVVQAAFRAAGGQWTTAQDVSPKPGHGASPPDIALDGAGNAVVVWSDEPDASHRTILSADRPAASGVWQTPQPVSALGQQYRHPAVAVDPAGDAVAVWQNEAATLVQAAVRPAGGAWSAPKDVLSGSGLLGVPKVAVDPAGNAVAVWLRSNGTNQIVEASVRPAGGAWSMPQGLSAGGQDSGQPQLTVDRAGNAIAVWPRFDDTGHAVVQAAIRPPGGAWSAPKDVSSAGKDSYLPSVAVDGNGNATLVWDRWSGTTSLVQTAVRPAGGAWGPPVDVAPGTQPATPHVALDSAGNAVVVWNRSDGSNYLVQSSRRDGTGTWSQPRDVSPSGHNASEQQVAVDPAGNAVAVWSLATASNMTVQAAGLDAAGPVLAGLAVPTGGTVGASLSFSVSPFDVWSALGGTPHWSFGDGTSADGTTVGHAYGSAGTFSVTVSSSDAVGNQSSATRSVTIAAPPPPPPPPPPPTQCRVPKVLRLRLAVAKRAITRAHCRTGKVAKRYSRKVKKGRVLAQNPRAGVRRAANARVNLVVSRGRKPHRRR
jgi:hypothetical protein